MRLFIALELPDHVRTRLSLIQGNIRGANWLDHENMHLTLLFLGEVEGAEAEDLVEALHGFRFPAFELTLAGVGEFSKGKWGRAIWAGVEPCPPLIELQSKISRLAAKAGLETEKRKYAPHVTLARVKAMRPRDLAIYNHLHADFREGPIPITHMTLFHSHLGNKGASYHALAQYPLVLARTSPGAAPSDQTPLDPGGGESLDKETEF